MSATAPGSSSDGSAAQIHRDSRAHERSEAQMPQSQYAAAWERLSAAFRTATLRVEPGQEVRLQGNELICMVVL